MPNTKTEEVSRKLEYHGATAGGKQPRLYQVWAQIKQRCFNKNHPKYKNYGLRGIDMDPRWKDSYATFSAEIEKEIGKRPSKKHTLDRPDNAKGYWPGNVRWAPPKTQNRNTRKNHMVFFKDKWRSLAEVSEMTGVDHRRLQHRVVDQGMSIDDAVNLPLEHGLEFYTYKGETHKLGTWAKKVKIPYRVLYERIHKMKWSIEKAFETPYEGREKESE
jgi:hypothetical protein